MSHTIGMIVALIALGSAGATANAAPATTAPTTAPAARPTLQPVPSVANARAALNMTIPQLRFSDASLIDVVSFLRDFTDANINVNWPALEGAGVTKDSRIELDLRGIRVNKALATIFDAVGASDRLTFYEDDNIIQITTRDAASQKMVLKVYPVADLLITVPDFTSAPGIGGNGGNTASGLGNTGNRNNTGNTSANGAGNYGTGASGGAARYGGQ